MKLENVNIFDRMFIEAYIATALWSSIDDNGKPLDKNYTVDDISDECLTTMINDCQKFKTENFEMISDNLEMAGGDFWLTRNGHGAGFWDGDWPEYGDILNGKCGKFGIVDLYIGDDGKIYCM